MAGDTRWAIDGYRTPSGERPIRTFIDSLEPRDLADALALIKLAEERVRDEKADRSGGRRGGIMAAKKTAWASANLRSPSSNPGGSRTWSCARCFAGRLRSAASCSSSSPPRPAGRQRELLGGDASLKPSLKPRLK